MNVRKTNNQEQLRLKATTLLKRDLHLRLLKIMDEVTSAYDSASVISGSTPPSCSIIVCLLQMYTIPKERQQLSPEGHGSHLW